MRVWVSLNTCSKSSSLKCPEVWVFGVTCFEGVYGSAKLVVPVNGTTATCTLDTALSSSLSR